MFSLPNNQNDQNFIREYRGCLTERFLNGMVEPMFSTESVITHIGFDKDRMVGVCGRPVNGFTRHRSGLNVLCSACKRRYFNALSSFLTGKYAGERILTPGADAEFEALSIYRGLFASPRKLARMIL